MTTVDVFADIYGTPYRVRVRTYPKSAYVEVWGDGGVDVDAHVHTTDINFEISAAANGESQQTPDVVKVLRMAALVLAHSHGNEGSDPRTPADIARE